MSGLDVNTRKLRAWWSSLDWFERVAVVLLSPVAIAMLVFAVLVVLVEMGCAAYERLFR